MRMISIDVLKLIMAVFILFIHFHLFKDIYPVLSLFLCEGFFRIAVPLFLLISGYFYLRSNKKIEYIKKLFYIYVFWSLLYFPFWMDEHREVKIIEYIIYGYFQLWYIPSLIFSILLFEIIKRSQFLCISYAIIFFISNIVIQYGINYNIFDFGIYENIVRRNMLFLFPYFYLGIFISKYNISSFLTFKSSLFYLLLSLFLVFLENIIHFHFLKNYTYDNFITLPFLVFFIFLVTLKYEKRWNNQHVFFISEKIYLTHGLFIPLISILKNKETFLSIIVLIFSVFLSYILYFIQKRNLHFKWIKL